jgi:antitoxin (DNA-binding transcriptional repressor) of toxin-antitoxin stability system
MTEIYLPVDDMSDAMNQAKATIKTVSIDDARSGFDDLLHEVEAGQTRVRIEADGQSIAGLVSAEELELLARLGPAWQEQFGPLLRSWAAFADETPERIEEEIERAVAEVRRKYPAPNGA